MNTFKLWGFDYAQAVVKGAAHLNVSQSELFAIAYRGWFKQEPETEEMQRYCMEFQSRGSLSPWVKHYLRQLDARTLYMSDNRPSKRTLCWGLLIRFLVIMLLPNSSNFIQQLQISQKFSLYC